MLTGRYITNDARRLLEAQETEVFLSHFDVELNPWRPLDTLRDLREINPRKEGVVRFQLEGDSTQWPDRTVEIITNAAMLMGMHKPETKLRGNIASLMLVLGGARAANIDRLNFAVEAIVNKQIVADKLVIAGVDRPLGPDELLATEKIAPGARSEIELCSYAYAQVNSRHPGMVDDCILVPDLKAGTNGVIRYVLNQFPGTQSLVCVTHQIYQRFTQYVAAQIAEDFNVPYILVGGCPSDPKVIEARKPATYMTEVIRTITAAIMLLADIDSY